MRNMRNMSCLSNILSLATNVGTKVEETPQHVKAVQGQVSTRGKFVFTISFNNLISFPKLAVVFPAYLLEYPSVVFCWFCFQYQFCGDCFCAKQTIELKMLTTTETYIIVMMIKKHYYNVTTTIMTIAKTLNTYYNICFYWAKKKQQKNNNIKFEWY